jgi:hypothetical protein
MLRNKKLDKLKVDLCYLNKMPLTFNYKVSSYSENYWKSTINFATLFCEDKRALLRVKLYDKKPTFSLLIEYQEAFHINYPERTVDYIFKHYLKLKPLIEFYIWLEDSNLYFQEKT